MPAHMLVKPPRGAAQKARRAKRRAKAQTLKANAPKVLARDGHCCRVCGSRVRLQVHHIQYRSRGGTHDTNNLVALCFLCHSHLHEKRLEITGNADTYLGLTVRHLLGAR